MTLLGYADDAAIDADAAAIDAAYAAANPAYTDAAGKPLTGAHPLIARSPKAAQPKCAIVIRPSGKTGGLLLADTFAQSTLGAAAVTARTIADVPKNADPKVYAAAVKAAVPAVEPVIAKLAAVAAVGKG